MAVNSKDTVPRRAGRRALPRRPAATRHRTSGDGPLLRLP